MEEFCGWTPTADGGKFWGGAREPGAVGAFRRAVAGGVFDFRWRLLDGGGAAGRGDGSRRFSGTSFGVGDLRRADRRNQCGEEALVSDERRAAGGCGVAFDEIDIRGERRAEWPRVGTGLGADAA